MPVQSSESIIVVIINDVDVGKRTVICTDKTNSLFQAFFRDQPGGIVTIPAQGERWTAVRIGYSWHLDKRLSTSSEQEEISTMNPGDIRLGHSGTSQGYGKDGWGSGWGASWSTVHFGKTKLSFNDATPINRPTVTGQVGDSTALKSLLQALEAYGLIVDDTV